MVEEQSPKTGGGAATQGGINFQNRVAAWVCVNILAQRSAVPVGPDGTAAYARFETPEPVDDILVGAAGGGHAFVQAKRTLNLSSAADSDLASAIDQFVRQYASISGGSGDARPWRSRPLDPNKDRFVIATTSESSAPVRRDLATVLDRLRGLTRGQPITDAALNADHRNALETLLTHVRHSWQEATGTSATDAEIQGLCSLMHVATIDVEASGVAEREALSLLESRVLEDPGQSGAAWATLLQVTANLSQRRSGIDGAGLRAELEKAGIQLKAPARYEKDIAKLKKHATETLRYLDHNSRIPVGETQVRVNRRAIDAIRSATESSSLVVVGWPGAGKSGVLHDFVDSRLNEGRDVVFIAVDQIGATSLGELRNELGLEHELVEVLQNWPGERSRFVVIDALDAARGDPASSALLKLIRAVATSASRWHVVASIRKYDLRYSSGLREVFRGTLDSVPADLQDSEFANLRHVNVPLFTDAELDEVRMQAANLDALLRVAPQVLHNLLRVPFNLRLMAEMLESGVDLNDLKPIRTQSELLNRYWAYRVTGTTGGDIRERILRRACTFMVEARRLRAERQRVVEPGTSEALQQLLSGQVLIEWQPAPDARPQRQQLAFSHNILFDFAVSQLFLPWEPAELARILGNDPDLIIMIRPSMVMRYQHLWETNREGFWTLLFRLCGDPQISSVGKVIGAIVLAHAARTLKDFDPLLQELSKGDAAQPGAQTAFRHLVGALTAGPTAGFAGPDAGPYCELLCVLTQVLNEFVAGYAETLLREILNERSSLTPDQLQDAGKAARNLLTFAWGQTKRNSWLATNALRSVCATFLTDPVESAALLHRSIEPEHLAKYGYEEMRWVARDLEDVEASDPELAADIYAAVFSHAEESTENTDISASRIMPMTSTRRQDYEQAQWQLAQNYPRFLQRAPVAAARAMLRVIDGYVATEHRSVSEDPKEEKFEIDGVKASFLPDYSYIWAEGASGRENEVQIANSFFHYFEEMLRDPARAEVVKQILSILVREARPAFVWARLLRLGAAHPSELGVPLRSLAWTVPVLRSMDTEYEAADFVAAVFPLLTTPDRERIEKTILSFPIDSKDKREEEIAERDRARLLGRLKEENLVTEEAKKLLRNLQAQNAVPPPLPSSRGFQVSSLEMTESRYVEGVLGVSAETEPHRRFLAAHRPVQEFQSRYNNSAPTPGEAESALPALEALHGALQKPEQNLDPKLVKMGCGTLAAACKAIAETEGLSCETPVGRFARSVLLEMSGNPEPEHNPAHDASFDEHPCWGAPIARIEAAEGLMSLARHCSCCDTEVLQAIERLGTDPAPQVRFQIANRLTYLYRTAPDTMWKLLEERTKLETSNAVLDGLAYALNRLAGPHSDRAIEQSRRIFNRVQEGPGAKKAKTTCLHTLVGLYIWRNHPAAKEAVYNLVSDIRANRREISAILSDLREPLTNAKAEPPSTEDSEVRGRAVELFHTIATVACGEFTSLIARSSESGWSESDAEQLKGLARLVDHAASELYFASGVFSGGQPQETSISRAQQERFYQELSPTIDLLSTIGIPSSVHHLIEMLEVFVPIDSRRVFLQVSTLVESGRSGGYQYESMGMERIVGIVGRYLAEYRPLLQEDAECRVALRKTLDAFVEAGWPAAQRLSYRLDELFR